MFNGEKIEPKVHVNQHDSVSDIQTPFTVMIYFVFLHELLMHFTISIYLFTFITVILVYCIERQTQRTTWINGVQIMNVFFCTFLLSHPLV
jgi:uncharacterized membrane protein